MKHLMVDVEALRLNQPWRAPLMEIGLVLFNEVGEIAEQAQLWIRPNSLPSWAEAEESTLEFWKSQAYWVRLQENLMLRSGLCKHVIATFHGWASKADAVWFAGPTYDQVMLEAYMDHYQMKRPWAHSDTRDFRTIRKQHDDIYRFELNQRKGHHNALEDCRFQVGVLREISKAKGVEWR